MAKSKVGGTRAYIRGRIGSDVYSVGKNGKGVRQQVVRSLAEQVSNPRTTSQMFGRMIMSTVMQGVSALKPIIDHSFDGVPSGQPSISEFIRLNYALVKADAIAHPASSNTFGLNKYGEKGVKPGNYQVSKGDVALPSIVSNGITNLSITLSADAHTVGDLRLGLGLAAEGYITSVVIAKTGKLWTFRVHVKESLADSLEITAANVETIFDIEGNCEVTPSFENNNVVFTITVTATDAAYGTIVSDKQNGQWVHNTCKLAGVIDGEWNADTALPTYPVGSEQFLNGGDL